VEGLSPVDPKEAAIYPKLAVIDGTARALLERFAGIRRS
jgi:hypothetical protein